MLQKLGHTWYQSFYTIFRKDFTEILHKECIATAVPQVGARVQIATDIEAACAPLARCDAAIAQVGLPLGLIPSKRRDRAAVATVFLPGTVDSAYACARFASEAGGPAPSMR